MAHEEEPEVGVKFKVHHEGATHGLSKIDDGAHKLAHTLEHITHHLTELGAAATGMMGGFGFERMLETGNEYLEQIGKMSKLTGGAADSVAGLRETFERADLSADQLAMTISAISKKSLMLEEGGKGIAREAKRWGVNLDQGPVKALISMSASVQKHKMGQAEVMKLTRTSGENLGAMMSLLEKGPAELTRTIEEARKRNGFLNAESLESFEKFKQASVSIHQSWNRLSAKVVTALAPALTKLAGKLETWMNSMGEHADTFGKKLSRWLELGLAHAKEIGRVLLANSLLTKLNGGKGLATTALQISHAIPHGIGHVAGAFMNSGLGKWVGRGATAASGAVGGAISGLGQNSLIGRTISTLFRPLIMLGRASGIARMAGSLLSLAGKASIIGIVVTALGALIANASKIGSALRPVIDLIWKNIQEIGKIFMSIFQSNAAQSLAGGILKVVTILTEMLGGVMALVAIATGQSNSPAAQAKRDNDKARAETYYSDWAYYAAGGGAKGRAAAKKIWYKPIVDEREAEAKAKEAEKKAAKDAGGVNINQDFRGSRFEINQAFSEGFDPDRIAVLFANDVASIGERQFQSTGGMPANTGIR